ncbi:branched-chain amino acid transporter permease [Mycetocola spongiae]|uniref:branched-chain amino acid transporter permease n=1 Tax=Mycetocola spongiae TaxID=2859226 RepID=UPI001CF3BE3E|nr:AzlD domain-containing protein [Mycetocola spongiae]UCR89882.1 AzlD domain-containing protein [Mycetocola spongiae]
MSNPGYILASLLISGGITWALRALPFTVIGTLRRSPAVLFLSEHLPVGIMVILVMYCLRGVDLTSAPDVLPTLIALNVTIGLQLWRGNALLSIFVGTGVNVALLSTAFA